ncbi:MULTISPECIES: hypothetical protein [Hungatella]|uniref:hypothetical protein n=1 Tax=Hungatella TaxID=1649459 RepID=UPI0022DFBBE6|nr:hypothetical protein [Hungatella effluvii]
MKKSEYDNQYAKENYDRIIVQVKKGKRESIKEYAKKNGYESLNAYINTLIDTDMKAGEKSINVHHNKGVIIGDNGTINMTEE